MTFPTPQVAALGVRDDEALAEARRAIGTNAPTA
jgi:hypothetical protein